MMQRKHSGEGAYWFAGQSDKTPERGQSPKTLTPLEEKLLQTGILVDHERNPGDNQLLEASILGGGFLANLVCACLQKQYPDIVLRKSDDPAGYSTPGTGRSVTIVCPESATRGDISRMNQACLQNGQPFGFIYYNGKNLVAGPIVIPGTTPVALPATEVLAPCSAARPNSFRTLPPACSRCATFRPASWTADIDR